MSTVFNDNRKSEQFQTMLNCNNTSDVDLIELNEALKIRQQSRDNLEQSWPPYCRLLKFLSQLTHIPSHILNNYIRTIFFLILFSLIFPLNLLITLFTLILLYLINLLRPKRPIPVCNPTSKRILISGGRMTKALQLCRSFYRAGHQIILVDESSNWLTGHRWSNSVERFYVHPSTTKEANAYINTLANIVRKEKIDMFIPLTHSYNAQIDSQVRSTLAANGCSTFDINVDDMVLVNDKYAFIDKARSLGLAVPKSFLITSRNQLLDFDFNNPPCLYICKSARHAQLNQRLTIKLPRSTRSETVEYINRLSINKDYPYILQEFISGKEYCTHGTCINGELSLFTCSHFSSSQLNYKHIDLPDILHWCTQYVREINLTGHISFNFIVNDTDGKHYAIGCNPYVNSAITAFYNHPSIADAYFPPGPSSSIVPLPTARLTYWLPNELWNMRSIKKSIGSLKKIFCGKEAIWSWDDPLPFLFHYQIHFLYLLFENLFSRHVRFFNRIDCCMGELA